MKYRIFQNSRPKNQNSLTQKRNLAQPTRSFKTLTTPYQRNTYNWKLFTSFASTKRGKRMTIRVPRVRKKEDEDLPAMKLGIALKLRSEH